MASNTRTTIFDARLLRSLVGTTVTTHNLVSDGASPQSSILVASLINVVSTLSAVSRAWVITMKLTERASPLTDYDVKMGYGSSMTVGKFLCHLAGDPNQIAFLRIYKQIPITGTEDADNDTLAIQAVAPGVCGELEVFKMLQRGGYSAASRFLGHAESTQGDHDLLPGGYIRYIVWEKVTGEPLNKGILLGLGYYGAQRHSR